MTDRHASAPIDAAAASESRRSDDRDADAVVLRTYLAPYPAYADHAVLADAGIQAYVIDVMSNAAGLGAAGAATMRVDLLVRREDLDAASRRLEANRRDSVDIDWDAVDVGPPADDTASRIAGRPPAAVEPVRMPRWVKGVVACVLLLFAPFLFIRILSAIFGGAP